MCYNGENIVPIFTRPYIHTIGARYRELFNFKIVIVAFDHKCFTPCITGFREPNWFWKAYTGNWKPKPVLR